MQRHRTDLIALFFGLAFVAVGAGFITHQTTGRGFDTSWIAAVTLVSIGCIFLGATLLRRARPPEAALLAEPTEPAPAIEQTGAASTDA
jgi:hypothetical protein